MVTTNEIITGLVNNEYKLTVIETEIEELSKFYIKVKNILSDLIGNEYYLQYETNIIGEIENIEWKKI